MTLPVTLPGAFIHHQSRIQSALQDAVMKVRKTAQNSGTNDLEPYYGQIQYQLGWVDSDYSPTKSNPGKLLRPTLLLLAFEAAGAWGLATGGYDHLRRALPAAAAIELAHNFTLIHDDIEDSDAKRRHRPTLWKLWGIPQAINSGDGLFALSRMALWGVLEEGVEGSIAARLGSLLDNACLVLSEGQYLDISFEQSENISVSMYVDMISRKTAALMGCAAELGAVLGTRNQESIERLHSFGYAMGIAFQVRDDLLGVWATTAELGKTPAGDIYRRKKSLPVLHALEHANAQDQQLLQAVYRHEQAVTDQQVEEVLAIFTRTETKAYCQAFLAEQCRIAHAALANVPRTTSPVAAGALDNMQALIHFVEETIRGSL